ncbi:hypothetical protein P3342_007818 [Pyrenophora teres f. teres]|nr:hypothetical protein P3342_007818 [Pyrenophora teres f. teres]
MANSQNTRRARRAQETQGHRAEKSATQHSRIWNLACAKKLQERLPRELRDLIYKHLLDDEAIYECYLYMTGDSQTDTLDDSQWLPHFAKSTFMGHPTAREILEMAYSLYDEI